MALTTKEIMEDIAGQFTDMAQADRIAYYNRHLTIAQGLVGMTGKDAKDKLWKEHRIGGRNDPSLKVIKTLIKNVIWFDSAVLELSDRFQKDIDYMVRKDIEAMMTNFVMKQTAKTDGIFKGRKIAAFSGHMSGNMECYLHFTLEDGAKFDMKCQVVWKYSPLGKLFFQFPTTFHNVFKANGEKIGTPSEAKLKKEL